METIFQRCTEESSGVLKPLREDYGIISDDDEDSDATLSAIEDLDEDDIAEEENYTGLSAEDLFRLIMSDHQYLSNTFPKCFGQGREGEGDGNRAAHGDSTIPDAAAIQHFFLKAMNLAAFQPIKDEDLKLKYSTCPSKCGLSIPFDKLANRQISSCDSHGSENQARKGNKPRRLATRRSSIKEVVDIPLSSATQIEGMAAIKDAAEKTIGQSQWTSECKAVFEKVQQASYLGCALTLLQRMWENYLCRTCGKVRQEEIERARSVDFCNEVRQMIEDEGRYVCQVIEEMEPTTFTTDFVV